MRSDRMAFFRKIWCRTFQSAFWLALPLLPYREPVILGSIGEIPDLLRKKGKRLG